VANAAAAEAIANTAEQMMINRRRPIRSPTAPMVIMLPPTMNP